MPSIPQSLLWISLVVLWLFVLVPMLISKRDAVRRTSDVALATRVLNGGAGSRLVRRGGPAAGHRSDPDWKPEEEPAEDDLAELADIDEDGQPAATEDLSATTDAGDSNRRRPVVVKVANNEPAEPDYLDVDVVEDSAALPAGSAVEVSEPTLFSADEQAADSGGADEHDLNDVADDRYEYVEDSSGLEPEPEDPAVPVVPSGSRRRRYDPRAAAAQAARKYAYRKRVLMVMAAILIGTATAAFQVTPSAWWLCGTATTITVLYLGYLRRQTRIEEQVRRRRTQRVARARLGVQNTRDRGYDSRYDLVPSRLRRPGAVVLEIDDEDPIFEQLENAMALRTFGWPRDLPRAVGE